MVRQWLGALLTAVCVPLASCASSDATGGASADADSPTGTVTVFAAASLTDAFTATGEAFEAVNPGITVEYNFAGSSALREQILAGAPADVFASADQSNMAALADAGEVEVAAAFATNELVVAVPEDNPGGVTGLADLSRPDLLVGLCAEEVPCGGYARKLLAQAGIEASIDTNEPDVRSLRTKLEAGDLDVGIIYLSDAVAANGRIQHIGIPSAAVVATYEIAVAARAPEPDAAAAFVDFVLSGEGADILRRYGFMPP